MITLLNLIPRENFKITLTMIIDHNLPKDLNLNLDSSMPVTCTSLVVQVVKKKSYLVFKTKVLIQTPMANPFHLINFNISLKVLVIQLTIKTCNKWTSDSNR
jgi:hypothetical protein